jgi:hypothetical protein
VRLLGLTRRLDPAIGPIDIRDRDQGMLEQLMSPVVPLPDDSAAVWLDGRVHPLPLGIADVVRAFGARGAEGVVSARLRTRFGRTLALGGEARSYADWVAQRLGREVLSTLHSPYATARFGLSPEGLSAQLAYETHCRQPGRRLAFAMGPDQLRQHLIDRILEAGGEVLEDVEVDEIEVADGTVVAVQTNHGREHVEGTLFVDAPLQEIAMWLPTPLVAGWEFDLSRLQHRHGLEVTLNAPTEALPFELHLIGLRAWKLTRRGLLPGWASSIGTVTAHLTLTEHDPLWLAPDGEVGEVVGADLSRVVSVSGLVDVGRRPNAVPVRSLPAVAAHRRRRSACGLLGIRLIGQGLHRATDALDDVELAATPASADEAFRVLFERPARLPQRMALRAPFGG